MALIVPQVAHRRSRLLLLGRLGGTAAALVWRAPTELDLPVVRVLPDGTYLTALIKPTIRGRRRARLLKHHPRPGPGRGPTWTTSPRSSTRCRKRSTTVAYRSSTWPGSWSTTFPTGTATAPAN